MDNRDLLTLMTFDNILQAELTRTLLESAGIQAIVQNELLAGMLPTSSGMVRVRLVVANEDKERALEVLSARFDQKEFEEAQKEYPEQKA